MSVPELTYHNGKRASILITYKANADLCIISCWGSSLRMLSHSKETGIIGSKLLDHDRRERGVRDLLDRLVSLVRLSELSLPTTETVSY